MLTSAKNMSVRIPAGALSWQVARFEARETLNVGFKSIGDFIDSCPAFYFGYGKLQNVDLLSLCHCIAERGIGWRTHASYNGKHCDIHTACFEHEMCLWACGACQVCSDRGSCGIDAQKLYSYIT